MSKDDIMDLIRATTCFVYAVTALVKSFIKKK